MICICIDELNHIISMYFNITQCYVFKRDLYGISTRCSSSHTVSSADKALDGIQ